MCDHLGSHYGKSISLCESVDISGTITDVFQNNEYMILIEGNAKVRVHFYKSFYHPDIDDEKMCP
jgi:hypothetical protein